MILLAWLVAAYGMTQIIVYGSIFKSLRVGIEKLGETSVPVVSNLFNFIHGIVSCMMCCSTWVGFFMGAFAYSFFGEQLGLPLVPSIFFDGMLASGGVWAINTIVDHFES
jgi:hypothetical protein|tara:strand:- start:67 stop:396 length:330 start_codon:yes stop_codon:yes gene_type:complete